MNRIIILITGFGIFLFSFILAFQYRFNHFYEFTLIGLFLILTYFLKTNLFSRKEAIVIYIIFIFIGLFVDLLSQFFKLWHYSYQDLWEYIPLYILIYPLGGIVMLQSYILLLKKIKRPKIPKKIPITILWAFTVLCLSLFISVSLLFNKIDFSQWRLLFMITLILLGGSVVNLISELLHKKSYLRDLIELPVATLVITLIVTYVNAFIHEYPNVFDKQWIYMVQSSTLLDKVILGVPIIVWIGWIALSIGPLAFYYLLHDFFKIKRVIS